MPDPNFMNALQQGANDDANSIMRAAVENLAALNRLFAAFLGVKGIAGSFTLAAAASLVVPQALVTASSFIFLSPANASAATLQGSAKCLYVAPADYVAGVSFTVRTADATNAASGEVFRYLLVNLT